MSSRTVFGRCDLPGNAATACGVGHQDRIAASERQVSRQCGALRPALFLHDLHEHHLPALDDFLNLVLAPKARKPFLDFLKRVRASDGFNRFFFSVLLAVAVGEVGGRRFACQRTFGRSGRLLALGGRFEHRSRIGSSRDLIGAKEFAGLLNALLCDILRWRRFGFRQLCCSVLRLSGCRLSKTEIAGWIFSGLVRGLLTGERFTLHDIPITATLRAAMPMTSVPAVFRVSFGRTLVALFLRDQGLPISDRNLVVVRMNFRKCQEAVAVAAVVDKGRLQRRLNTCDLG